MGKPVVLNQGAGSVIAKWMQVDACEEIHRSCKTWALCSAFDGCLFVAARAGRVLSKIY